MTDDALADVPSFQRFVLLAVAELDDRGEDSIHSYDVRAVSTERVDAVEGDIFGGVTRSEVIAALSELEAAGLLSETLDDRSPVGKGRPAYELALPAGEVLDALADDDHLGSLVERLRDAA